MNNFNKEYDKYLLRDQHYKVQNNLLLLWLTSVRDGACFDLGFDFTLQSGNRKPNRVP